MNIITRFPIGQYVDGKRSWLRIIDSRLKLIILFLFLITPIWSGPIWRISLVLFLILITFLSFLPLRIWWRSFVILIFLSITIGILSILATSNISSLDFPFRDIEEIDILLKNNLNWNFIELPIFSIGFFKFGPYYISSKAIDLGIKTSTLIFTVIHSVNLILLTTLKEEIVWTISWFMHPFRRLGIPIDKLLFQLLLALRFIPLVQEELQNIIQSVSVRSINLRKLGLKNSFKMILSIVERLFINILLRIDQGSESLLSKGSFDINTERFKPLKKQKNMFVIINGLSIFFIFVAIFLRKQYGSI